MSSWIKCTDANGGGVWLNLDHATHMFRRGNNLTRVVLPGHGDDFQDVKENPDELIRMANFARQKT